MASGRRAWLAVVAALAAVTLFAVFAEPGTAARCVLEGEQLLVSTDRGERVTIGQEGDAIAVHSTRADSCAAQPMARVASVAVTGTEGRDIVVFDLGGGTFAGGVGAESGDAEIEFFVDLDGGLKDRLTIRAAPQGSNVAAGDAGIALNFDDDADVLWAGVEEVVLDGGPGPDVLSGNGGRGTGGPAVSTLDLRGGGGADVLAGGFGDDRIAGGSGNDELSGGRGDDLLVGASGEDIEVGGRGNDTFDQGLAPNGDDVLFGQSGRDTVSYARRQGSVEVAVGAGVDDGEFGAEERDLVASDIETVLGGLADDILRVPATSTTSYTLVGGKGADLLVGGAGDDVLHGGPGHDTVSFARAAAAVRVNLLRGRAEGMGVDRLSGLEDVVGSRFADILRGNAVANTLDGWRGSDLLQGRAGDDLLIGGRGQDELRGDAGRDTLEGDRNDDLLLGGRGSDVLTGGAGNDWLFGEGGTDSLDGGLGHDTCERAGDRLRACEVVL